MNEIIKNIFLNYYDIFFAGIIEAFKYINNMGAEIFDLPWIKGLIDLFAKFGWALFAVGALVSVFEFIIEYKQGKGSLQNVGINILKGFFAATLFSIVPVSLYKFAVSLQAGFSYNILAEISGANSVGDVFTKVFNDLQAFSTYTNAVSTIAICYCVLKCFFQNIKRGGIILIQICIGSLYMFSVPRGITDGFISWFKQIIALCLMAFIQTTLLLFGIMTWAENPVIAFGIMLAASEAPRIAQQFGLDTSAKINPMGFNTAANVGKSAWSHFKKFAGMK